ncbi:MAG: hypothetical protein M3P30_12100 [Chloroflexota bacterium]|nr:hypothetical protein [Chloroflexota bacterium]
MTARRSITGFALACAFMPMVVLVFASCGGDAKTTHTDAGAEPRSFMMGISTLPRELNAKSYQGAFQLAADNGDMVLIQRTPPWSEFLPGADVSADTANTTAAEHQAAADKHLKTFFAIDPTDGATGRDRLSELPPELTGAHFDDARVRQAFVSYARYVALNYKPSYLALGVEMNLYYNKNKDDLANFESLYAEAYDRVKEISPDTQITVTFQYEDLRGVLPTEDKHFADWQLLKAFEPKLDVAAISTYPSFVFASAAAIPQNYYSQLSAFTSHPIVIAEMGYASAPGPQGVNNGTEADQDAYLKRVLSDAESLNMPFVVWFAGWDPSYAKDTSLGVFQHIGLRNGDNSVKPAWQTWADAARRPYAPAVASSP